MAQLFQILGSAALYIPGSRTQRDQIIWFGGKPSVAAPGEAAHGLPKGSGAAIEEGGHERNILRRETCLFGDLEQCPLARFIDRTVGVNNFHEHEQWMGRAQVD